VSRRRRISRCQACSGVDGATIGTTAVVFPAAIQKRAEPIAIRVPDLEFVARSIGQRWIGEKLSTELEEAFRKLRLRRRERDVRVGSRRVDRRGRRRYEMSAQSPCDLWAVHRMPSALFAIAAPMVEACQLA